MNNVIKPWMNLSPIDSFIVNKIVYRQGINLDNDSSYLVESAAYKPLLEFTCNCDVFTLDESGNRLKRIAHFYLRDNHWFMAREGQTEQSDWTKGRFFNAHEGLLKDEVDFSKAWLAEQ